MIELPDSPINKQMLAAIDEIEQLILAAYPGAVFEVSSDEESGATWVTVWADFDGNDWDDVVDIYIDRLLDIQDDQGLWLHFMPVSIRDLSIRSTAA